MSRDYEAERVTQMAESENARDQWFGSDRSGKVECTRCKALIGDAQCCDVIAWCVDFPVSLHLPSCHGCRDSVNASIDYKAPNAN